MGLVLPVAVAAIGVWIAFSIVAWATGPDTLRDRTSDEEPAGLGEEGSVTESDIAALRFDTGARGYRTAQVDAALRRLAWEIGRRDEQIAALEAGIAGTEEPSAEEEAAPAETEK